MRVIIGLLASVFLLCGYFLTTSFTVEVDALDEFAFPYELQSTRIQGAEDAEAILRTVAELVSEAKNRLNK